MIHVPRQTYRPISVRVRRVKPPNDVRVELEDMGRKQGEKKGIVLLGVTRNRALEPRAHRFIGNTRTRAQNMGNRTDREPGVISFETVREHG
jgi:hypothetical protein